MASEADVIDRDSADVHQVLSDGLGGWLGRWWEPQLWAMGANIAITSLSKNQDQ